MLTLGCLKGQLQNVHDPREINILWLKAQLKQNEQIIQTKTKSNPVQNYCFFSVNFEEGEVLSPKLVECKHWKNLKTQTKNNLRILKTFSILISNAHLMVGFSFGKTRSAVTKLP